MKRLFLLHNGKICTKSVAILVFYTQFQLLFRFLANSADGAQIITQYDMLERRRSLTYDLSDAV